MRFKADGKSAVIHKHANGRSVHIPWSLSKKDIKLPVLFGCNNVYSYLL